MNTSYSNSGHLDKTNTFVSVQGSYQILQFKLNSDTRLSKELTKIIKIAMNCKGLNTILSDVTVQVVYLPFFI